ncbi:MAG: phosphotransferase [Acidimicrobiales bacterium]
MERTTSLVLDDAGVAVVRHVAPPGPAAEALRHEAVVLHRARGLGVVELVEAVDEADGGAALATRYVAGGTLDDVARDQGERAALAVLARVAELLARLHEVGIVHGRCTADHVVGTGDDIALCGLSGAMLHTTRAEATADTEGFALLVQETCSSDSDLGRRARRAVAGLATSPPATNLRAVAGDLAGMIDVRPKAPSPRGSRPDRAGSPARRAVAAAAVAVGVGLLGGLAMTGADAPDERGASVAVPSGDEVAEGAPERTTTVPPAEEATPPVQVWPEPEEAAAPAVTTPAAAGVVEHGGIRYQVGAAGDLVVVGDWDCDGLVTPSVVRPADGSVWLFPGWAANGEVLVARSLGFASSPVAAAAAPTPEGCHVITVTTADGREIVIRPG